MKPLRIRCFYCLFLLAFCLSTITAAAKSIKDTLQHHIFFLHNKFIEEHQPDEDHPQYGNAHYPGILAAFRQKGFVVHSEKRPPGTDIRVYARKIVVQIDSLLKSGVPPGSITVIGTSKGGYIAQYVSTYLANPNVNFVFIGCYRAVDLQQLNDINFCGNILTIYETSDEFGVSALDRKLTSHLKVSRFHQIALHTGLQHGFLFRPLADWIAPAVLWAQQRYDEVGTHASPYPVIVDTLTFFDHKRGRKIPVAIYRPQTNAARQQLVVFSHGYGGNRPGSYMNYSYLTEFLALQGYFVVSIQHELAEDSLIPSTGIPQVVRRPFWERGAENILSVINQLKKTNPGLDFRHITLIGHSNGGDMVALFAQKYPEIAGKIITLDNRRMPLPATNRPRVYSLRSCDQPADEGVLPTNAEQQQYGMKIIRLPDTAHNDMDDHADVRQRNELRQYVMTFLKE